MLDISGRNLTVAFEWARPRTRKKSERCSTSFSRQAPGVTFDHRRGIKRTIKPEEFGEAVRP